MAAISPPPPPPRSATTCNFEKSHARAIGMKSSAGAVPMTPRKIAIAFGSCDQRDGTPSGRTLAAVPPVRMHSVRYDQLSASRSAQNTTAAHSESPASFRSGLPNGVRTKRSGVLSATTPKLARARNRRYKWAGWAPHKTASWSTDRSSSPRASATPKRAAAQRTRLRK